MLRVATGYSVGSTDKSRPEPDDFSSRIAEDLYMATTERAPSARTYSPTGPTRLPPPSRRRSLLSDELVVAIGVPATAVGLWIADGGLQTASNGAAGALTGIGQLTGFAAALSALAGLALASRLPWIERRSGLDQLLARHRVLGIIAATTLAVHMVALLAAYSMRGHIAPWSTFANLFGESWMPAAVAGGALMLTVALTSWRRIRSRMSYETWFHLHVLGYVAVVLAFGHVLVQGSDFVGNWVAQAWWWSLYLVVAAMVLVGRVGPLLRSLVHPLRVVAVDPLPDGSRSVWVAGRSLPRMRARSGQYFQVRFGVRGIWWQSHPYSLSAAPFAEGLRFSFRAVGDDAEAFARIRPGTRVWLQGPYGALDAHAGQGAPVVLVAGGSGIAPLRALLDDMTVQQRPIVLLRCSDAQRAWFIDELATMVTDRGGRLHVVSGRRQWLARDPFSAAALTDLIPDLPHRHAYVCGPTGMARAAQRGLREAGMPSGHIHTERYDY